MKHKLEWEIGQLKGSLTALNNTRDKKDLEDLVAQSSIPTFVSYPVVLQA